MAQDALNNHFRHSQAVQIATQTAPGSMPAVPFRDSRIALVFGPSFGLCSVSLTWHTSQRFSACRITCRLRDRACEYRFQFLGWRRVSGETSSAHDSHFNHIGAMVAFAIMIPSSNSPGLEERDASIIATVIYCTP